MSIVKKFIYFVNNVFPVHQLLYESSHKIELKRLLSNSEDPDWVLYMTVLNMYLHCLSIVLNINNVLSVYQLLMESSHNLELKYVLSNNEDSDWFTTSCLLS